MHGLADPGSDERDICVGVDVGWVILCAGEHGPSVDLRSFAREPAPTHLCGDPIHLYVVVRVQRLVTDKSDARVDQGGFGPAFHVRAPASEYVGQLLHLVAQHGTHRSRPDESGC